MMSGNSETISNQLKWLFDAGDNIESYIRLEPKLLNASPKMDDASKKNMNALKEAGIYLLAEDEKQIDLIVTKLLENKGQI